MSIAIIYDGECPVCSRYIRYLRLRDAGGVVVLVDARQGGSEVDAVRARGLEIDSGFVLRVGDRYFHGADAMNRLALMSTPVGAFNRLNHALFSSRHLSRCSYPVLRTGRNLLLRLLGRSKLGF